MTSHPYIPDDDFIEEYLREPLTPEKRAELQKMRDEWEQQQQEELQRIIDDDPWMFMVSDYSASGEGRTVCLMMTTANPNYPEDFVNSENNYVPSTTQEYRARRKFKEKFGDWYVNGLEFLTKEQFFNKYSLFLPQKLVNLKDKLCSIEYHSELHFNFS